MLPVSNRVIHQIKKIGFAMNLETGEQLKRKFILILVLIIFMKISLINIVLLQTLILYFSFIIYTIISTN